MNLILLTAQIVGGLLALVVLANSYDDYRRGRESLQIFLLWAVAAAGILVVTLFPQVIDWAMATAGGQRTGLGTVFGLGLVFLFYLSYRIFVKADRVERELTNLVRKIALENLKKHK